MRLRSGDQFPRGFPTDSDGIPNEPESAGIPGMGMGMGRKNSSKDKYRTWKPDKNESTPRFTERKQTDLAWARAKLPGEHPPFVSVAMDSLRLAGREVTPGAVMDRLRATKKDRAYRVKRDRERGWPSGDDAA